MNINESFESCEGFLSQILGQFYEKDQQELAERLVNDLGLTQSGKSYVDQVQLLINRPLTESEKFKIEYFERICSSPNGRSAEA